MMVLESASDAPNKKKRANIVDISDSILHTKLQGKLSRFATMTMAKEDDEIHNLL